MHHGLGRHVLVECYGVDFANLDDLGLIRDSMLGAAEAMGATIIGQSFHKFCPQGVSGAVVIAESHLTIHTWPELGYAAVDYFTCGECDPHAGFHALKHALGAETIKVSEFVRGFVPTQEGPRHVSDYALEKHTSGPATPHLIDSQLISA